MIFYWLIDRYAACYQVRTCGREYRRNIPPLWYSLALFFLDVKFQIFSMSWNFHWPQMVWTRKSWVARRARLMQALLLLLLLLLLFTLTTIIDICLKQYLIIILLWATCRIWDTIDVSSDLWLTLETVQDRTRTAETLSR